MNILAIYTVPSGKRSDPSFDSDRYFTASEIETFYETIKFRSKKTAVSVRQLN